VHARAQWHDQRTSNGADFIQISSMIACTREPRGTPLHASESLHPRGFLGTHCKYARLPFTLGTTTNPSAADAQTCTPLLVLTPPCTKLHRPSGQATASSCTRLHCFGAVALGFRRRRTPVLLSNEPLPEPCGFPYPSFSTRADTGSEPMAKIRIPAVLHVGSRSTQRRNAPIAGRCEDTIRRLAPNTWARARGAH
jgi:hypothetical protein